MLSRFKKFLEPPTFDDDPEKTRQAKNLSTILKALAIVVLLWSWYPIFIQGGIQIAVALTVIGLVGAMYTLLQRGHVKLVSNFLTLVLWVMMMVIMGAFGGVKNSGFSIVAIIIIVASLTINARAGLFYAIASILGGILLVIAENRGLLPPYAYEPNTTVLTTYSLLFIAVGLLLMIAIQNTTQALQETWQASQKTKEALNLLEQNSAELQARTNLLERQNTSLQLVAEVARLSAQIKDQDTLLNEAIQLLCTRLKIDHAAIFLADEEKQYVHLVATNSPEGKALKEQGYKLPISSYPFALTVSDKEQILHQVGEKFYTIPLPIPLTNIRTNSAYALASPSQLIGLLNLQTSSPEPPPIDPDVFHVVLTQIALSLENIRLVQQLQTQIQAMRQLTQEITASAWQQLGKQKILGYAYNHLQVIPIQETFPAEVYALLKKGQCVAYQADAPRPRARLIAPIILRDNLIGILGYEDENLDRHWHESEMTLLQAIAGRVSLALENSRLVAEAQQRAEQERTLSQIASRIRETLDIETIIQTAVAEIQKSYKLEEAEIRLQPLPGEQ
jgi:GAF domain-containing protein